MPAAMIAIALVAAAPETPRANTARVAIDAAMADSAAGWNGGDLGRFVAVYAPDAVYVTAKGIVRGRPAIAARYAKSFSGGANARGRLTFAPQLFRMIDPTHALFIARWTLTPRGGAPAETGMTTLLFAATRDGWRIASDHSS